jgi:PAS domain S-box-containing protein
MRALGDQQVDIGKLERIFPGGSEMARRMRSFDWSQTILGVPEAWPLNLRTCVRIILTSRQPMFIWWGKELIHLYNDGYVGILGAKHPAALAQPAPLVWTEVWDVAGPRAEFAMSRDEGTYDEALPFIMLRKGYPEETYVTFSYSPIPDDQGGFGGILCPAAEDTQRIIGERQLALLRELPARTADARTWRDACRLSAKAMETNPNDLPFALIYSIDRKGGPASLAAASGIAHIDSSPETPTLDSPVLWPLEEVCDKRRACLVSDLSAVSDVLPLVLGYPVRQAIALPVALSGEVDTNAILVAGLNPLRPLDDNYRSFLELVAGGILAAMVNAESYEAARRRAEALAELDRAKTVFFSNVSHEFRTPLTLLLGPLEEELREHPTANPRLIIAHRNALRLLRLVNTLLDFSRIEAGRIQAVFVPTDLGTYTAELASVFRSAIEKAGLHLTVNCPSIPDAVYVDREMWEKIVLNLLSNALKFTFEGEISVCLRQDGEMVELAVRDTGTGIPASEVPHLFERFHRVRGARGRSLEGSGIGLALVQELVKLHGGAVRVESELDHGSVFTVTIPLGTAHLPADHVETARPLASTALGGEVYVEEALRWLPEVQREQLGIRHEPHLQPTADKTPHPERFASQNSPPTILFADDNADMREYVGRLLSGRYKVEAAIDGLDALKAARERAPDLVLTDVMMPRLDGFGLLRELRADERLKTVPVIMLSARAGEEASVEGIESGADDYLIKPFSARELVARVDANLKLARLRTEGEKALRESEQRFRLLVENVQEYALVQTDPEGKLTSWNPGAERLFGYSAAEIMGRSFLRLLTIEDQQAGVLNQELACVFKGAGQRDERWLVRKDGSHFWAQSITEPVHEEGGRLRGVVKVIRDETERKRSEERQSLLMSELNHRVKNTLATVQAIASQTFRGADPGQFLEKFKARLQALARAHSVLTRRNWESADVTDLVRDQLAMDLDIDRITLHGPAALLTPQSAVALSLVLHELGTNARKYGALAGPRGRLDVHWREGAPEPMLHIEWTETGGPPVAEPQQRGFGTMLIEKSLEGVGGSVELRFPVGVCSARFTSRSRRRITGTLQGRRSCEEARPAH